MGECFDDNDVKKYEIEVTKMGQNNLPFLTVYTGNYRYLQVTEGNYR